MHLVDLVEDGRREHHQRRLEARRVAHHRRRGALRDLDSRRRERVVLAGFRFTRRPQRNRPSVKQKIDISDDGLIAFYTD